MRFIILFFLFLFFSVTAQIEERESYSKTKSALLKKAYKAYNTNNQPQLSDYLKEINSLYKLTKDSVLLAEIYNIKALENILIYNIDSSYKYYYKSKEMYLLLKDSLSVGIRLSNIGLLHYNSNDFTGSEMLYVEALKYLEPQKNSRSLKWVYRNLGLASEELESNLDALQYYNLALQQNDKNLKKKVSVRKNGFYLELLNYMAVVYEKTQDYRKGLEYIEKGLDVNNIESKYPFHYASLIENKSLYTYWLNSNYKPLPLLNKALKIRAEQKDTANMAGTHTYISKYYLDELKLDSARVHAKLGLQFARKSKDVSREQEALQLLALNMSTGKKAVQYFQEYISLNDSVLSVERKTKNRFARIKYQSDKKEKENSALKIENDKKQTEIIQQKQQNTISWLVTGLSILLIIFGVIFYLFRRKQILYEAQLQKIEVREEERKQIAKSLHDEVAGDLRLLHKKLENSLLFEEAQKLDLVKENVRNLSHQLSSVSFEKVSFKNQIINLVSDYFEPTFIIKIKGLKEPNWTLVKSPIKRLLYLSTRECIQNSQKYANASRIEVNFELHKKNVLLSITDNGKGFDTNVSKKGIGLQNLEERILELKGKLIIESKPNDGVKIHIQIPLNA